MTLKEKIDSIDYSKIGKPEAIKSFVAKVEEKAKTSMTEAQALMDGILVKIQEKYPDAITKKIAPEKAKAVITKLKKLKNIVPRKADYVKVADQIQKQQPNFTRQQAEELAKLRIEAQIARSSSFNDMIDVLSKSSFYSGRLSTAPIDKGRGRDLQKDSNRGSITEADELKMRKKGVNPRKYKRISKAGHKNQYGTTSGGNVYYEYRDNRRDVDSKIRLAQGGLIGKEVEFLRYGEPMTGRVYEDLGNDRFAVESTKGIHSVDKENIVKVIEPKKGRFFGLFKKGGRIDLFETPDKIPAKIQEILDFYEEDFQDGNYNGLSKALKEVEAKGYTFEFYLDGEAYGLRPKNVPLNHIKGYEEYSKGGGVGKFKYERGQKFQDQYGEIILLDKYSDGLWEARRWSGMRHVGDVVISEKDLDLIRTKKMAQGDLIEGRFQKHFKKGGNVKATYIPNASIKSLTTKYGSTIKGKDLLDGAYTTRKNVKLEPKVDRFMFEEEMYEYKKGGVPKYALGDVIDDADTPKVWVGEWSLYNEGKLIGEWVDLTRFNSGAEVMQYIQTLLDKWTKETGELREEYAIFDYENFPSSLYSEQMGEDAFDKVLLAYHFSQENDIPMDVVGTIIEEYGADDLDEWFSERYAGQFDSDTDLAYWYVDEMLGGVEQLDKKTQEMYFDYESFGRDLAINDYRDIDGYYFQAYKRGGMTKQSLNRYFKRK
jgi:antirestriction protein